MIHTCRLFLAVCLAMCAVFSGCGSSCLKDKGGCADAPKAPVSPCIMGGEALSLAGILDNPPADGSSVSVQGPLRRGIGMCTEKACSAVDACCNGCGASLVLSAQPSPVDLYTGQAPQAVLLSGKLGGVSLACGGDESLLCCPLAAEGEAVIISGTLRSVGTPPVLTIEVTGLCSF